MSEFEKLFMNVPPSEREAELHALAEQYHRRAESHDRFVCSFVDEHGTAVPGNGEERRLMTVHAIRLRSDLCREAVKLGFTTQEFQRAVYDAAKKLPSRG